MNPEDTKICPKCQTVKLRSEFTKNRKQKDGLNYYCRDCSRAMGKQSWEKRMQDPEKRAAYLDKERNRHLKRKFGISAEDYQTMLDKQNGACAICKTTECSSGSLMAVDHCHSTGKIRGILCRDCNTTLGKFNDSIERFEQAIRYLRGEC